MRPLWTSAEAEAATGGRAAAPFAATGVSIDTRTLQPGDLFVALRAARDGHDFVAEALAKGAAGAMVARRPDGVAGDAPLLVVPEVQAALEALGRAGRARAQARVGAITGSVGKTSAKEMLRTILAAQGATHASEASYNNHWGVPLTLARLPAGARFAVIEIGMNHPGEIAPLARMAAPDAVLITTIAAAHLEAFADRGGLDGIAAEKASICAGLRPGGTAVLPADVPQAPILHAAAEAAGARIVTFGRARGAHHRLLELHLGEGAACAAARAWRTPIVFKVGSEGGHFAHLALGVLALATALGADRARALLALADWSPPEGRGTRETILPDPDREDTAFELIDDAFNANPASLAAALAVLAAARPRDGAGRVARGRRIAFLGDMLELGPAEARIHAEMAADPGMAALDIVHCVGPRMAHLHAALPEARRGRCVPRPEDLLPDLRRLIDAGDVVLVKGSKGSRVSLLVDAIRKLGQRRAGAPEDAT